MTLAPLEKIDIYKDESLLKAIHDNYAVIEFTPDGIIIDANDNFFKAMGFSKEEVVGKHHKMFCDPQFVEEFEYKKFWKDLAEGKSKIGEFKRYTKDHKEVWLGASYTPIFDEGGKVVKVVKFAQDKTKEVTEKFDYEGKMKAIDRAQAVIEFDLEGNILWANENFLKTTGYRLHEIEGKHHRIFCDLKYSESPEYKKFWQKLGRGEFESGEYKRFSKDGKDVWINASYNPIFNAEGKPVKVVKFASDVTEQKLRSVDFEGQINAIDRSQATIEFTPTGEILTANKNFLDTLGYSLSEVKGKHHRIFCDPKYTASPDYQKFWEKLAKGEFDAGEYKRIGNGGKEVWINASYNPIFDMDGKVTKVVKYASDLTKEKLAYNNLVNSFESAAEKVMASASQLSSTATQMSQSAEETLKQSQTASSAAEQLSMGISSVGASMEEMQASIKEISQSALNGSHKSEEAKTKSKLSNEIMSTLDKASEEIGEVIKMISSIAQQTNLLALNATIEAARAGEAGKGFAVVASEVKELAKQTGNATNNISAQIGNVQTSTKESVEAISGISELIETLSGISSSTAAAVEEQSAATSEVNRIVQESTIGVTEISNTIRLVANVAEENSQGAQSTLESANILRELSEGLLKLVEDAKKE